MFWLRGELLCPPPPQTQTHTYTPTAQQATADLVQSRREEETLALNPSHRTLGQQALRTMIWNTELRAMKPVGQARLELIAVKQT